MPETANRNGRHRTNGKHQRNGSVNLDLLQPAQNLDAERSVLGALFFDNGVRNRLDGLRPSDFFSPAHQLIAEVVFELIDGGEPADLVTVAERLVAEGKFEEIGGKTGILEIAESVTHAAYAEWHAKIVREKATLRVGRDLGYKLLALASHPATQPEDLTELWEAGRNSFLSPLGTKGKETNFSPVPMSDLGDSEPVDWVWDGWLARGFTTLFVGFPKAGKTTALAHLLAAAGDGGDIAGQVAPSRWLVVTEEATGLWKRRRDDLAIGDHVLMCVRPFPKGRPSRPDWDRLIENLAHQVRLSRIDAVVFDTFGNLAPQYKTNDDAETVGVLAPLQQITDAGAGLLLVHHAGKTDVGEGKAARGSSALTGWVDVICEMRRYDNARMDDSRRRLGGLGRFDETPQELVVELTDDGYVTIGSTADTRRADLRGTIRSILDDAAQPLTVEQVRDNHPAEQPPSLKVTRRELEAGYRDGVWQRHGKGVKGDAHRYGYSDGPELFDDDHADEETPF